MFEFNKKKSLLERIQSQKVKLQITLSFCFIDSSQIRCSICAVFWLKMYSEEVVIIFIWVFLQKLVFYVIFMGHTLWVWMHCKDKNARQNVCVQVVCNVMPRHSLTNVLKNTAWTLKKNIFWNFWEKNPLT